MDRFCDGAIAGINVQWREWWTGRNKIATVSEILPTSNGRLTRRVVWESASDVCVLYTILVNGTIINNLHVEITIHKYGQ